MSRPVRVEFPGPTYHVLSHGVDGACTFADDLDRITFLDFQRESVTIQRRGAGDSHRCPLFLRGHYIVRHK